MKTTCQVLLFFFSVLSITISYAQLTLVNEPDKPSVQSSEMTRYGKYDAQLYTGKFSLNIPIYVYRDTRFTIPISLSYSYNGFVPNRQAGIAGLGWSLVAGGCITREVRGIPDELYGQFKDISNGSLDTRDIQGFDYIPSGSSLDYPKFEAIQRPGPANVLKTAYEISGTLYETTSDIYHFSFPGHSGSFYRNGDGTFTVFHTSSYDGNYRIEKQNFPVNDYNHNVNSLFVITTSDGYRYTFGEYSDQNPEHLFDHIERHVPPGHDKDDQSSPGTPFRAVSFLLRKIESPDGATATFNYGNGYSEIITYGSSLWLCSQTGDQPSDMLQYTEDLNTCNYLSSIEISGVEPIEFFYADKPEGKQGTYLQGVVRLNISPANTCSLLDSIATPAGGVKLSYIYNTQGNPYPFLTEVHQDGIGSYRFEYEGTEGRFFPAFGTVATDHWGYLNTPDSLQMNRNSIYLSNLGSLSATSFDEIPPASRNANSYSSSLGQMTKVFYPTGGGSAFFYEPNYVWRNLRKMRANFYSPAMYSSGEGHLSCGPGQRVSSVVNLDENGIPLDTTSFRYYISEGSTGTSGSLLVYPRYRLSYAGMMYMGETIDVHLASSSGIASHEATPVEYSRVEEVHPDGSRTVHHFTCWDDVPDEFSESSEGIYRLYTNRSGLPAYSVMQIYGRSQFSDGSAAVHSILSPAMSCQHGRGREKRTEVYSAEGSLLHRTQTAYERDEEKPVFYEAIYVGEAISFIARNTADTRPVQVSKVDFQGSTEISSGLSCAYNRLGQKKEEVKTLSSGDIVKTSYTFIPDISESRRTAVQKAMLRKGRIGSPVKVSVTCRQRGTSQDILLSCDSLTFSAIPVPSSTDTLYLPVTWSRKDTDSGLWRTYATYIYDSRGDMLQRTDADSISTAFIWYADNSGLALRIDNATQAQVTSALGYSPAGGIAKTDTESVAATLRNALPQSEVSWYKWFSYGLPSHICDPSGRVTRYSYDEAQRLKLICDDSQDPVERYFYQTSTR